MSATEGATAPDTSAAAQVLDFTQTPLQVTSPTALDYFSANPSRPQVYFGDYLLLQTLGEGEFGKVKLGVHRTWGEEAAIKLIKRDKVAAAEEHEAEAAKMSKVEREIHVLKELRHPNIVHLYEVIESERYIGIVLEYGAGGELFDYILAHKCLKERDACRLFAQLISGVSYLHRKKIIHRDLKLENLLLDRNRNVIITDFGFANNFSMRENDHMSTSCGSPCYAAPELVVQDGMYVGAAVDVWSCGVILYAMLAGYLPFDDDPANPDGDNINLLYKYIMATPLTFPDYIGPQPRSLLQRMLVPDPKQRATLSEVMEHPWLAPYRDLFYFSVQELERAAVEQQAKKRQVYREQMLYQERLLNEQSAPAAEHAVVAHDIRTPNVTAPVNAPIVPPATPAAAPLVIPAAMPVAPSLTSKRRIDLDTSEQPAKVQAAQDDVRTESKPSRASGGSIKPLVLSNGVGSTDLNLAALSSANKRRLSDVDANSRSNSSMSRKTTPRLPPSTATSKAEAPKAQESRAVGAAPPLIFVNGPTTCLTNTTPLERNARDSNPTPFGQPSISLTTFLPNKLGEQNRPRKASIGRETEPILKEIETGKEAQKRVAPAALHMSDSYERKREEGETKPKPKERPKSVAVPILAEPLPSVPGRISLDTTLEKPRIPSPHTPVAQKQRASSGGFFSRFGKAKDKRAVPWWRRLSGQHAQPAPLATVHETPRSPSVLRTDEGRKMSKQPVPKVQSPITSVSNVSFNPDERRASTTERNRDAERRFSLAGDARTAGRPFFSALDDRRLNVHVGAVDQAALTTRSPDDVMQDVVEVLYSMGIQMRRVQGAEFRLECVRRKRPGVLRTLLGANKHDDRKSRLGKSRPTSVIEPRPSASGDGEMEHGMSRMSLGGMPSSGTGLSRFSMDEPALVSHNAPLYGDTQEDGGQEIRFSVALTRISTLHGLYSLDIRRMKGNMWTYKYLYHAILARIELGGSVPMRR
ncbi:hypothetical protein MVES1_003229 [Malassezia vespertilionis]|uniref:non-specific serine/threonine protein kinase n=1 Tax=Malassezia vespertilionis TaxID=2020962 RepID=A0A2N1J9J9_9BASI|nr:uncharacterized protein MVES1_003229 [Malassezia vespertilionis]PKI83239.1 hypothetical protein MVES_003069 [Malassezia vespertilionis]WFD07861.1 hypothetical protein MVES1_003229 [Malassezia vespertilionis]